MATNLRATMEKMEKEIAELENGMSQKDEQIAGQKVQIAKLAHNNRAMKRQMERIFFCIPSAKKLLIRRPLPAELLNEMFAALPLERAFGIFAEIPNGLLGRNVRKMLKSMEMAMKNNKWNSEDCGPKLRIADGGLEVKHVGPNREYNCVRAELPIPKLNFSAIKKQSIACYFEVQLLWSRAIAIGFCTEQFPIEGNWLGKTENSIGIHYDNKIASIYIDEKFPHYHSFQHNIAFYCSGDVVGIGIVHSQANSSPMKCFASCNGELLGIVELPDKFATLQLFPAIDLSTSGVSIRANFGKDEWRFNPRKILQNGK